MLLSTLQFEILWLSLADLAVSETSTQISDCFVFCIVRNSNGENIAVSDMLISEGLAQVLDIIANIL